MVAEGYKHGDTVALFMTNRPEYVATWLGCAKVNVLLLELKRKFSISLANVNSTRSCETVDKYSSVVSVSCLTLWRVHVCGSVNIYFALSCFYYKCFLPQCVYIHSLLSM